MEFEGLSWYQSSKLDSHYLYSLFPASFLQPVKPTLAHPHSTHAYTIPFCSLICFPLLVIFCCRLCLYGKLLGCLSDPGREKSMVLKFQGVEVSIVRDRRFRGSLEI